MSTKAAATETASTTVTTDAPVIPGREEVLKHFAREASGLPPETAAPPPENEEAEHDAAENEALSQSESETTAVTEAEETEAEETPEAEVENHLDEELSESLTQEVQERINRRIGKEVAKTKAERIAREALETELAEAKARLEQAPAASTVDRDVPLANIHDPAKLDAEKVKAEQALEQSEDLLLTLEDDPSGVEKALRAAKIELKDENGEDDFSEARMKKFLRGVKTNADRTLRRAIPERARFIEKANQFAGQAMELMPELKDAKSPRAQMFRKVLSENPELQRQPEWALKTAVAVLGMERLNEMLAAKTKAKAPVKPKRELPVTIPTPRAQAPTGVPKGKAATDDLNTAADKILGGDKSARLSFIKGLVPKG